MSVSLSMIGIPLFNFPFLLFSTNFTQGCGFHLCGQCIEGIFVVHQRRQVVVVRGRRSIVLFFVNATGSRIPCRAVDACSSSHRHQSSVMFPQRTNLCICGIHRPPLWISKEQFGQTVVLWIALLVLLLLVAFFAIGSPRRRGGGYG